jgi:PII-like signaling protein
MTASSLLRIYTDEAAYFGDRKVYEVVASRARDEHLSGVTVLEALLGFGRSAHVHRRHVLENDRAVVIEIVDSDDVAGSGLITLEPVEVLRSESPRHSPQGRSA